MIGFVENIEQKTLENTFFRQVLYTGQHEQLVLMSLKPGEDIGTEVHKVTDQFLRIEKGSGKVIIDGNEMMVESGTAIIVPAGSEHNLINTSSTEELKLYTIYAPAHHKDKVIHKTKEDAQNDTQDHL